MSTKVFAAGCTMSSNFMMVAPSLEMVTWPLLSTMSLSMPLGPSVVLTVSTTAAQALMLERSWPLPWDVSVPSFKRMICGCYRTNIVLILGRHVCSERCAKDRRLSTRCCTVRQTRRGAVWRLALLSLRLTLARPDPVCGADATIVTIMDEGGAMVYAIKL